MSEEEATQKGFTNYGADIAALKANVAALTARVDKLAVQVGLASAAPAKTRGGTEPEPNPEPKTRGVAETEGAIRAYKGQTRIKL